MSKSFKHIPVMLEESLSFLNIKEDLTYIDATLGMGGHSKAILERYPNIKIIGIDRDSRSLEIAKENLKPFSRRIDFINSRFSKLNEIINEYKTQNIKIGGVLLDLGISSFQLEDEYYGLSFKKNINDIELNMKLDSWCNSSAAEILNKKTEKEIADIFFFNADYKKSRALARLVVKNRPLNKLKDFINLCSFSSNPKINSATLPLMALRIEVNDEFNEIKKGLRGAIEALEQNARIVVLSFHSGEDRIVKNIFKENSCLEILTNKPLIPSLAEIKNNPRARSAKLRAVEKNKND